MLHESFQRSEILQPDPKFDSRLASLVIELEKLRSLKLEGTTQAAVFFELKQMFHFLESIGSARIEGNRTTVAEFLETQLEKRPFVNEDIEEIRNIDRAMTWIDEHVHDQHVTRAFISELHKQVVNNLTPPPNGEGDPLPGLYRQHSVEITGAEHTPPPPYLIHDLMDELLTYIHAENPSQFDLIKVAVAHHRFMWIHPFGNGNGRVGRLLTYAMLVRTGFKVHMGQILNPTAVFCINRDAYNHNLAFADKGTPQSIETWCEYVLEGLDIEIRKIEKLADGDYVYERLLQPALTYSLHMKYIDRDEYSILKLAASRENIRTGDAALLLPRLHKGSVSRKLKSLRDKGMLRPENEGSNRYRLSFINSFLSRGMIQALETEGYIPIRD